MTSLMTPEVEHLIMSGRNTPAQFFAANGRDTPCSEFGGGMSQNMSLMMNDIFPTSPLPNGGSDNALNGGGSPNGLDGKDGLPTPPAEANGDKELGNFGEIMTDKTSEKCAVQILTPPADELSKADVPALGESETCAEAV